ncbi:hypothetical protein OAA91_00195 [Fibrobacterales bacterium]|nr:hypothetical protein [Fibrobacterales bacterium]
MKISLKEMSEIVAQASDLFIEKHKDIGTAMGIIDQALRKQGIPADGVTIDCLVQKKKIVFFLHDSKPDSVEIALGNKEGDIFSSKQYLRKDLDANKILEILEESFTV